MIEDALTSLLSQDAALKALIAGRVYALIAPQGVAAPYVVFSKVVERGSGTLCAEDPMVESLFDFDSYAKTMKQVQQVAKAIRSALIDFRGTVDDTYIASIRRENEMQNLKPEPGLYSVSTSLFIWHGD